MSNRLSLIVVAALSGSLMFTSCATNPVTGKKQVVLMSEEQELAIGKEADPQIVAEYGLYNDNEMQQFINSRGQEMAKLSHRPNIAYTFRVLDSDVINAFALPGGYVYFTRGIMASFNDEAQFAGVLGHEIGHITARHSVQQQTRATLSQVGLLVGMVVSDRIAQFAEQASQGLQLMMLSYSRDAERQSDELGVEYSSKAGYDAKQMANFFLTLQRQSQASNSDRLPEFLSTHPDPGNRYSTVTQLANKFQQENNLTNLKINRDGYLKLIAGTVYGEDPRQGFRENGSFYHPELRFQFRYPTGWQYKNSPTQVSFAPSNGQAVMFMTLAQGNDPQSAAQAFLQKYQLQASDSRSLTVNGLPAVAVVAQQQAQQTQQGATQSVGVLAYFIQYNGRVYEFVGASTAQAFNQYAQTFQGYFGSFAPLTDQRIINIKPERIKLVQGSGGSLQSTLTANGIPQNRLQEFAILNGMELNAAVASGKLVKVVERR